MRDSDGRFTVESPQTLGDQQDYSKMDCCWWLLMVVQWCWWDLLMIVDGVNEGCWWWLLQNTPLLILFSFLLSLLGWTTPRPGPTQENLFIRASGVCLCPADHQLGAIKLPCHIANRSLQCHSPEMLGFIYHIHICLGVQLGLLMDTHTYIYTYNIYIYIHIYMYTYIHTDIHTYIHIHILTCIYIYIYVYTNTYMYIQIHICIYKYIYIHIYIHTYKYIHIYIYKYIHTFVYTHIYIDVHTYIYIYAQIIMVTTTIGLSHFSWTWRPFERDSADHPNGRNSLVVLCFCLSCPGIRDVRVNLSISRQSRMGERPEKTGGWHFLEGLLRPLANTSLDAWLATQWDDWRFKACGMVWSFRKGFASGSSQALTTSSIQCFYPGHVWKPLCHR